MPDYLSMRNKLIAHMDQLAKGVDEEDPDAILEAQQLLARVALYGSPAILAQTLRGILSAWDADQAEWDKMMY